MKLKQELPDLEFKVKQTEVNFRGIQDDVKISNPYLLEKVIATI